MAPVGCWESLSAAIQAGANSVYFGIEYLNMRARSSANFTTGDLHRIAAICREAGIKTYLTLNTVMYPEDLPLMREIVDHAKAAGLTAIIASDIAVLEYAYSVGVEVHLSTQLNIANTQALRFYAQYADVAVLARELNLDQVAAIHRDIEEQQIRGPHGELMRLEMFCHGALCMAVSGKCYLSLNNLGASANRGACMQVCRRGYIVKDKESDLELEVDNQYIMSPKDLKTIHFLNKILDAGVSVLKIEGRARGPEYVKTVVECYREAVEAWQNGHFGDDLQLCQWDERLRRVFNRGFWDGYYLGQRLGEWTHEYGSTATRKKIYAGKCTNFFKNIQVAEFQLEAIDTIREGDELLVTGETSGALEMVATDIHNEPGLSVQQVHKGERFAIKTPQNIHRGDKLFLLRQALVVVFLILSFTVEACTSIIVGGRWTESGLPMMFKNRDTDNMHNAVVQVSPSQSSGQYAFIGLINLPMGGPSVWSGTNEVGFAIMNTASYNLRNDTLSCPMDREGELMYRALADCRNTLDFERLLDTFPRPMGVEANFGVIDLEGGAAYYEVNNFTWTKYDVNDTEQGYRIVTNFSQSGREEGVSGWERYLTACALVKEYAAQSTSAWTANDMVNLLSRSYRNELLGVDYSAANAPSCVPDQDFIPRRITSAVVAFESMGTSRIWTMWTILGYPACGVMIPLQWNRIPTYMSSTELEKPAVQYSQMCELALIIKNRWIFPYTRSNGHRYLCLTPIFYHQQGREPLLPMMQSLEQTIRRDYTDYLCGRQNYDSIANEWLKKYKQAVAAYL